MLVSLLSAAETGLNCGVLIMGVVGALAVLIAFWLSARMVKVHYKDEEKRKE